jgi:hypothetical protein
MSRDVTTIKVTGTTIPGNGSTGPIPLDYRGGSTLTTVQVIATATITYSVEVTADPVNDINQVDITNGGYAATFAEASANWFAIPGTTTLTAATTSQMLTFSGPYTAIRLIATSVTGGNAFMRVLNTAVAQ